MRATLAILCLLAAPTRACEAWSSADTAREAIFAGVVMADLASTRGFLEAGQREHNPLLGDRPTSLELYGFGAASLALHAGVACLLAPDWRFYWQTVWIGIEVGVVAGNVMRSGVKFAF